MRRPEQMLGDDIRVVHYSRQWQHVVPYAPDASVDATDVIYGLHSNLPSRWSSSGEETHTVRIGDD